MVKRIWVPVAILVCGIMVGIVIDRDWPRGVFPIVSAQQGRRAALPTMESLPAEVAQLKLLVPSNVVMGGWAGGT